jgi:hypothetical protein
MQFITETGYDVAAIMRDAHRRAKRMRADGTRAWGDAPYAKILAFYLNQVWILAQHERRAARCTGATVTVERTFDNGGSPLWRM